MTETTAAASQSSPQPHVTEFERRVGHPPGLVVLFLTEMWERFSYFGMRGLLVLYMTQFLFVGGRTDQVWGYGAVKGGLEAVFGPLGPQPLSSQIYGLYTGFVYLTPILGGMLADRWLGQRRAVLVGGAIMAVGQFMMTSQRLFFPALVMIVIGSGAFKPNIATQVGNLYGLLDPRRDRAFSIFYVGINLGALLSPLVCATLVQRYGGAKGWAYGFGAAGVGMLFGLTVNVLGRRYLAPEVRAERRAAADGAGRAEADDAGVWKRVAALVALCALNIVFWAAYEQQGNTMQLWADQQTRWPTVFGFTIPSPWFQAFNPAMVFLLTPVLQLLWAHQSLRRREPSSVSKMAFGCLVLGLSFVVMAVGAHMVGGGKGSLLWPLACTLMLTVGELYLSPIGLSLVTKVAPRRMISMMMGVWFLASFFGNYLSGFIGMQYERMSKENFFLLLAGLGIGAGLAMAAFKRPLERAIGNGAGASPA